MNSPGPVDRWESIEPIVERVAAEEDVDPVELPPIGEVVDPDALTTLLASTESSITVTFTYCGYDVVADTNGHVSIE